MRRAVPMSLVVLALSCGLVFADPGVRVTYVDGTPQIQLGGSYAGSSYTVFRGACCLPTGTPWKAGPVRIEESDCLSVPLLPGRFSKALEKRLHAWPGLSRLVQGAKPPDRHPHLLEICSASTAHRDMHQELHAIAEPELVFEEVSD